jgi:hypothetical protein
MAYRQTAVKGSVLLRRREVWAPTWAGWALLALIGALSLWGFTRSVHSYLAQTAPTGHGLFVVEGWLPDDAFMAAVEAFRRGSYERFVVTGGPIEYRGCAPGITDYATRGATLARALGIREAELAVVPAPASAQERTFRSAVSVRQWAEVSGGAVAALDLYSYGTHARRSRWLYQLAFGDGVNVGVLAGRPTSYSPDAWWRSSDGTRAVLSELIAWTWVRLFFHPGAPGSWEEQWGPRPAVSGEKGR